MPQPSYKAVPFELLDVKASGDAWSFSGYASTFGNVDEGGDVVMRGAFSQSLKLRPKPRLLWQHDIGEPLGVVTLLREDEKGLFGEWKISRTTRGQDAYTLLKDGAVDSMSIGYFPTDFEFTDDGIRKLKSVDLLEVSVVSVPMNEEAMITAVKALERLPLGSQVDRLLEDARRVTARCKSLASLRAKEGRPSGETVRRFSTEVPEELKALAAEAEELAMMFAAPRHASSVLVEPVDDPAEASIRGTSFRLEIARRKAIAAGILEHAS